MALFDALGFRWDRDAVPRELPRASVNRVVFRFSRMLPEYVWDAGVLEGNPFTFPEVKTLLDGVTVGGRKVSDLEQILNLADSSKYLIELVKQGRFRLDKQTACSLNARVARNEALEWGHFRGEGAETLFTPDVVLGARGRFTPLPTQQGAARLNEVFTDGVRALQDNVSNPFERAAAFFLFGSLQQFFFDGNKRTSRFMMNGVLMTEGIDAISIPAIRGPHFNSRMVDFYITRDATEMMAFVLDCHPEIAQIRQLNPGLSVIKDVPSIHHFNLPDPMSTASRARQSEHDPSMVGNTSLDSVAPPQGSAESSLIEEIQRNAAEKWVRREAAGAKEDTPESEKSSYERDAGSEFDPDR